MGGFVSYGLAAFFASVYDNVPAPRVGLGADRHEKSAAWIGSVAGVDIHVQRMKTKWAVVSRGVAERQNLTPAVCTDKSVVVFCKSFAFHSLLSSNTLAESVVYYFAIIGNNNTI